MKTTILTELEIKDVKYYPGRSSYKETLRELLLKKRIDNWRPLLAIWRANHRNYLIIQTDYLTKPKPVRKKGAGMITHNLKIENEYLRNLLSGAKKSEIRINDRDYQVGDILRFSNRFKANGYKMDEFVITHIHSGLGLEHNYVVLSVKFKETNFLEEEGSIR